MISVSKVKTICSHCGEKAHSPVHSKNGEEVFCCNGCQLVYECIQDGGLKNFYEILKSEDKVLPAANMNNENYRFIKEEEFSHKFSQGDKKDTYYFYIEGIECLACTWIFTNITTINKNIQDSKFQAASNILELVTTDAKALYEVISFINKLGYKIIPLEDVADAETHYLKEKKNDLVRIGITGGIWMNIMIFSIAIYSGAGVLYQGYFNAIISVLFIPIITYSAWPFYKNVINQTKNLKPSLDLPIVLSIILGAVLSYRSYFTGSTHFYFDSLAMFIFFILSTRYLLFHLLKKEVAANLFDSIYHEQQAILITGGKQKYIHISQIKLDDTILIKKGSIVPLDGTITKTHSYFNESLITGESAPMLRSLGENIQAGIKNITNNIELKVTTVSATSSFHNYLNALKFDTTSLKKYAQFGDTYSIILSVALLIISMAILYFEPSDIAYQKVLSLMIICCPCALGIGIPLATLLKLKSLAKKGVFVRDHAIFEKFDEINELFFDKTGTLTTGQYTISRVDGELSHLKYLVALEERAEHPIAKFLVRHFQEYRTGMHIKDFKEIPGFGVSGIMEEKKCEIYSGQNESIVLSLDGELVLKIFLSEIYDQQNIKILNQLANKYAIKIISGDNQVNVNKFTEHLDNQNKFNIYHSLSPEAKQAQLQQSQNSLYIGDGLNDVLAMKEASISISLNASQLVDDVCSVVFLGGTLKKLLMFFTEVNHLHKIIKHSIIISIIYNITGLLLVLTGIATPLLAAVLMPLSSLSVVVFNFLKLKDGK